MWSFIFCISALLFANPVSALTVKEMPLKLHMDDAQLQSQVEKKLSPLVQKLDAVAQELDQLNKQGKLQNPSADVKALLQLCEQWQTQTHSNFTCRLGALQRDWDAAVGKSELPDRASLRQKARLHLQLQWKTEGAAVYFSEQAIKDGLQLDLHGLWQGWVLERVAEDIKAVIAQQKSSTGVVNVEYGNLTLVIGATVQQIKVADVASVPVSLKDQTLAVLDRQQNLRKVAHYPLSSLLVPKEGWPVELAPSLLVRASSAIEAGVMAQALISVSVHDALEQVNKMTSVTALAITETGMFFASKDWYGATRAADAPWSAQKIFTVDYEIPSLDVAEYRRPYVAIWIADDKGNSVRQLQLLGENRWLRDLRLWWRKVGRSDDSLVDALAGATRKPGRYRIEWDGRDAQGKTVAQGNYELHIEVAREHGEHELLLLPFILNGQTVSANAKGTNEIGRVSLGLN
ncbi:MAG: DUF2271 domain-containing protein [Cellvibrio sp.]|uniref:DUF2271 domain-containing protein n=1 Tax=Cellvibrio sp. TaxID=1965322 RepID=UPI0031A3643D